MNRRWKEQWRKHLQSTVDLGNDIQESTFALMVPSQASLLGQERSTQSKTSWSL
jgi:hypothetical protein